jgi:starch phosphorylase
VKTEAMKNALVNHLVYSVGKDPEHAVTRDWCVALSLAVRDRVVDHWMDATRRTYDTDAKRVYYLSMEFLIGRLLSDTLANLGLTEPCRAALEDLGVDFDEIAAEEPDAALGNGGLGRLAACFLDSVSTLGIPTHGYGLRYEHGLFKQFIEQGWQMEEPEDWLTQSHPWEFERPEVVYPIGFYGDVEENGDDCTWHHGETIMAAAYDTPVPGWRGRHVNTLRLWAAKPAHVFDLESFNRGDYLNAAAQQIRAETITRVLYPDDTTPQGQELRLRQEYFFSSASAQDLVRRFLQNHDDLTLLPEHAAIQLNDTHPAIAVPELLRILEDVHGLPFDKAFEITRATISYTNHTLLPEALERWPVDLLGRLLPRHLQIIRAIDDRHLGSITSGSVSKDAVRILDGAHRDMARMGHLAFVGSHRVNGVSALHTDLMKKTVFHDLHQVFPDRIVNETNGITPRRWLNGCNRPLSDLITQTIGEGWVDDLEQVAALVPHAEDSGFRDAFAGAKRANKVRLAELIRQRNGIKVDPSALFDIQIKRIHEYKRQHLNILQAVAHYQAILAEPERDWQPRVRIFAGKAAPGYAMAKKIIKLINDVAAVVNNDPVVGDRLKIVYLANYNVSLAEMLIPAADLSEQISTAGMEASGTGNMKFALNGALTVGTLDGANVEIRDHVGEDNIFIFGMTAEEVFARRAGGKRGRSTIEASPVLTDVLGAVGSGQFSPDDPHRFDDIVAGLHDHDYFMVAADFDAYHAVQSTIDRAYGDQEAWMRKAILNSANMGWFSSDRTIRGYAADIWDVPVGSGGSQ